MTGDAGLSLAERRPKEPPELLRRGVFFLLLLFPILQPVATSPFTEKLANSFCCFARLVVQGSSIVSQVDGPFFSLSHSLSSWTSSFLKKTNLAVKKKHGFLVWPIHWLRESCSPRFQTFRLPGDGLTHERSTQGPAG